MKGFTGSFIVTMRTLLVMALFMGMLFSCNNREEQKSSTHKVVLKEQSSGLDNGCLPCCEECPAEGMKEVSKVFNDSVNVIYIFMKGFDDKDCCIYGIAELVNNRPFSDKYSVQHIFLIDYSMIEIIPNVNFIPDDLKKYVIAHEYMDKKGMKTIWDPFNSGNYSKFKKYKNL